MNTPTWWAKVDNNQVVDLIIVNADIDAARFTSNLDGVWVQSPESGPWAQLGGFWDDVKKEFYAAKPHESWTLDSNNVWQAPTPYPNDGKTYVWYEVELKWMEQ